MSVTDGIAVGWTSPMIPYFLSDKSHIKMTREEAEWLESYLLFGALAGLPITIFLIDKIGRKRSLILSCGILVITWTVIALAQQIIFINISRFLQGLGLNMAFVAGPIYVGEISHKSIRGLLSSMIFVLNVIGLLIIYTTGPLMPYVVPSIIACSILIIEIIVFSFLPESPHYLTAKGRHDEAEKSLRRLRRCSNVEEELTEMRQAIEEDHKLERASIRELIFVKNYRKSLIIMITINFGTLFCCGEVILMNLHEILEAAGSVYVSAAAAGISFSSINLVSSVVSSLIVDKFGRVKLLLISVVLTGVCLLILAVYFHLKLLGYDTTNYSWLPIVTVMAYGVVFRIGLGMVPMVMTAELFASRIKSFAVTLADGLYVASGVLALQVFFVLRDNFGMHAPFYTFFVCAILTSLFVIFFVPETKGRSLDEIQRILKNELPRRTEEEHKMLDLSAQIEAQKK